jgi:hypothetical protein
MLNHNATIERDKEKANLVLTIGTQKYYIALTDDNPADVKKVFNNLIVELKKGKFSFTLVDETQDLFFFICEEYIKQLNGEIADVYSQLKKNELVSTIE